MSATNLFLKKHQKPLQLYKGDADGTPCAASDWDCWDAWAADN